MATKTDHLELTLPQNGEFIDDWDTPVNANFELIDDHAKALNEDLVGVGGSTSSLSESGSDLSTRLDVGLEKSGSLKIDSSDAYTDLDASKTYEKSSSSDATVRVLNRLENPEREIASVRNGTHHDRYGSLVPDAMSGVSQVAAMYANETQGIQSPIVGATPNTVIDGPADTPAAMNAPKHLQSGTKSFRIDGGTKTVKYNIDGYIFDVDGETEIDLVSSGLAAGTYHTWVSRNSDDYTTGSGVTYLKKYNGQNLGGNYKLDPRIIPFCSSLRADADTSWGGPGNSYSKDPTNGVVTKGSTSLEMTSSPGPAAEFSSYGVRPGDVVVVSSPASLVGEYIVDSVVSNTKIEVVSKFRDSSSAVTFHIERRSFPAIGFTVEASAGAPPVFAAGRVYIGKFTIDGSSSVTSITPYAYGGVYDTGWIALNAFAFAVQFNHYLGVFPASVSVQLKAPSGDILIDPKVPVDVQHADYQGNPSPSYGICTLSLNATITSANKDTASVMLTDPLRDTGKVFYDTTLPDDYVAYDDATYSIRIIARR